MKFLPRYASNNDWSAPASAYQTDLWQQVVAVYQPSSNQLHFFINGVEKSLSGPASTPIGVDNVLSLYLGQRRDNTLAFKGGLDDVRIYNRALSSTDVKQLYAVEFPDADHDGLNDLEEVNVYHTDPSKADTDGDGFNDYAEVYNGHDPLVTTDFPAANLSVFTAIELEFATRAGSVYQIQASPDLATWTNFDSVILGDGNIWKKPYSIRGQDRLYHRVDLRKR